MLGTYTEAQLHIVNLADMLLLSFAMKGIFPQGNWSINSGDVILYQNVSFSEYEDRSGIIAVGAGCATPSPSSAPVMSIKGHGKKGKKKIKGDALHVPKQMRKHNNGMTHQKKQDQL